MEEETEHVIQTAWEQELEVVPEDATSGSHFKAAELILWQHTVGEGFPGRGCPGENIGWEQGCTTVGLGCHRIQLATQWQFWGVGSTLETLGAV